MSSVQSLLSYAVTIPCVLLLRQPVQPAMCYQLGYPVLYRCCCRPRFGPWPVTQSLLHFAVGNIWTVALCRSAHTFFFLWSCAGRATLWLYYLLYVTCTHRQCKSSLNNSKDVKWHEWNSLLAFLQKTCLTPQISSTKYQEKCFERDADPDNLLTLMSPWFSRLKQTYEQLQNKFWKLVFWDCNSFTVTAKYFTNTAFWDSDFEFQFFFRTFYSDIFILLKYKKKFCAFSKSLWYISLVFPALPRMEKSQLGPSAEH